MKPFKFFQKPDKGDLSMLGGEIFSTMSYDDNFHITGGVGAPGVGYDTPDDHYARRRLYHTNPEAYRAQMNERYYMAEMTTEMANRINIRDLNDNRIEPTPTPNPNWYQGLMKLKNWVSYMYGVVIFVAMILSFFILLFTVI